LFVLLIVKKAVALHLQEQSNSTIGYGVFYGMTGSAKQNKMTNHLKAKIQNFSKLLDENIAGSAPGSCNKICKILHLAGKTKFS